MAGFFDVAAGAVIVLSAWLLPRHIARSPVRVGPALLLDAAPLFLGAAILVLAAGRPLFAGLVIAALGAGFALADWTMRSTLREPVVFCEMSELPQVFTHPHLYLPFAGPALVLSGAAAAAAAALALLVFESPLWTPRPLEALVAAVLIAAGGWLVGHEPLLGWTAAALRRLRPSGEPFADAARLGPFAMLLVHCTLARAERRARQAALRPAPASPGIVRHRQPAAPLILVQCESFFDARRLPVPVPPELLHSFDACCRSGAMFGRLDVPCWGANTMRAEFAVLTGIPERDLGYDRFNPYYALARVPVASQVWRLRRAGYRTLCLHPFSRTFFRRDLAMPALGFEKFLGSEALGGSRSPPYCADPDLARQVLQVLDAEGPQSFIFVITMGNHGPWPNEGPPLDPAAAAMPLAVDVPEQDQLRRYLDGLRRSDEMLRILADGLAARRPDGILAFYGDHLPSLSRIFGHLEFNEPHSDYVIWPGNGGVPRQVDLPAHRLGRVVVDALLGSEAAQPGTVEISAAAASGLSGALAAPSGGARA